MTTVPKHLGGHLGKTHTDKGVLKFFYELGCRSMIDIGCGPGGQIKDALDVGYFPVLGVDGDPSLKYDQPEFFVRHDYQDSPYVPKDKYDLVWSCEFVEHVKPEYIDNFMQTFDAGTKYVAMTFHPPSKAKHGKNKKHFNEQHEPYWIDVFKRYGWVYDEELTKEARKRSTMTSIFFRARGLVFKRVNSS